MSTVKVAAAVGMALLLINALSRRWLLTSPARIVARLGARRPLAIAMVFSLSLLSSTLVAWRTQPLPQIHDEFSYLLAADTFAHGRLTNPTHPLWTHFETFHVIQQPTYQSKYPPAHALFLAAGQRLTGDPRWGLRLELALACAAICWMLQAFMPPRWALWGGIVSAFHPLLVLFFGQSYWGSAASIAGGALVYGALGRIVLPRRLAGAGNQTVAAAALAGGLALLANSRPYEGLLASLPAAAVLGAWLLRQRGADLVAAFQRVVLPCSLLLSLTAAAMGYYNFRVTGHPLRMPYQVHESTYGIAPVFLWQKPYDPPTYRHRELEKFNTVWQMDVYRDHLSLRGAARKSAMKVIRSGTVCLNYSLAIPLLALPWALRRRGVCWSLACVGTVLAGLLCEVFWGAHYIAPAFGPLLLLVVQSLRQMRCLSWQGRRTGRGLVRAVALLYALWAITSFEQTISFGHEAQARARQAFAERLQKQGGEHLVFVRYRPDHNEHFEWVHNAADIDAAPVVWAREMSREENEELRRYFAGRRVWVVEADAKPPTLKPWTAESSQYASP